jgi:glutamate-5-semialdehyde dehydrogenase
MIDGFLQTARSALSQAPPIGDAAYPRFARSLGEAMVANRDRIAAANAQDVRAGRARGLPEPLLHRIALTGAHYRGVASMAQAVAAELDAGLDGGPVYRGRHGTRAWRVARPLGVLLMIYEARPTVTIDGALLPVCAGNAVMLRGGAEIASTNRALAEVMPGALARAGLPEGMVQVLHDVDRPALRELLRRDDAIDVLIPRGSPSLLASCRALSRIPMITGGGGVNHMYVHSAADLDLAVRLLLDGKLPEPEGCTALEAVVLDAAIAGTFLERLTAGLAAEVCTPQTGACEPGTSETGSQPGGSQPGGSQAGGSQAGGSQAGGSQAGGSQAGGSQAGGSQAGAPLVLRVSADLLPRLPPALAGQVTVEPLTAADLGREFMCPVLAITCVPGPGEAIAHVNTYGTGHTEGIVTQDEQVADEFCRRVDAAAVVVNGSVRLHDGPALGLGTEIAISTGRLHVRGPVTLRALMTYGWRVDGNGASRFRSGPRWDASRAGNA